MNAETVHSVFRWIAAVLAGGGAAIVFYVLGSLCQSERAKELAAELRRLVDRS